MQQEAQEERERNQLKKLQKKEHEMRVLTHNEQQMSNKQQMRVQERIQELSAFNEYKSQMDQDEAKRAHERSKRQDHIKALLNRQPVAAVELSVLGGVDTDAKIRA